MSTWLLGAIWLLLAVAFGSLFYFNAKPAAPSEDPYRDEPQPAPGR